MNHSPNTAAWNAVRPDSRNWGHTSRAVGPCEGVSLADVGSRPGRACRCACRRPCAPRREGETGPWIAARKKKQWKLKKEKMHGSRDRTRRPCPPSLQTLPLALEILDLCLQLVRAAKVTNRTRTAGWSCPASSASFSPSRTLCRLTSRVCTAKGNEREPKVGSWEGAPCRSHSV